MQLILFMAQSFKNGCIIVGYSFRERALWAKEANFLFTVKTVVSASLKLFPASSRPSDTIGPHASHSLTSISSLWWTEDIDWPGPPFSFFLWMAWRFWSPLLLAFTLWGRKEIQTVFYLRCMTRSRGFQAWFFSLGTCTFMMLIFTTKGRWCVPAPHWLLPRSRTQHLQKPLPVCMNYFKSSNQEVKSTKDDGCW